LSCFIGFISVLLRIAIYDIMKFKERNFYMKPQDVVILTKILASQEQSWTQMSLSRDLGISQSEISEALHRSIHAGLIGSTSKQVNKLAFEEFLIHGLKYVFSVWPGMVTRGIPTAHSAPALKDEFMSDLVYVWPYSKGEVRGEAIEPLYKSVPEAVQKDAKLYEYLSLIELLRVGKVREQEFAKNRLKQIIANA
jgi:hypothetical protein